MEICKTNAFQVGQKYRDLKHFIGNLMSAEEYIFFINALLLSSLTPSASRGLKNCMLCDIIYTFIW